MTGGFTCTQHGGITVKFKVIALAAMMGFGAASVQANELPNGPHIVTSGTASVDAVPDIATLAIEVNVSAKDAAGAKKQADDRVAQYLTFLQNNGVEKKDVNAANLRTQPEYEYLKDGKTQLKGYRAVRTVEVTLRKLDKLNELLDGALKAGLNEIRSVSLAVAHPDEYKDKARKAAIDDAVRQAQQLASGFNSKLGPVYSVRYHVSNYQPTPMMRMMKAEAAAPASAQDTYDQQTIQFDDQVDVVFELQPSQAQSGTANQNGTSNQGTAPAATNAPSQQ
nr:oxidative stress defense protein [Cronobacter dublinensis]